MASRRSSIRSRSRRGWPSSLRKRRPPMGVFVWSITASRLCSCAPVRASAVIDVKKGNWPRLTDADIDQLARGVAPCGGQILFAIPGQEGPFKRITIPRALPAAN